MSLFGQTRIEAGTLDTGFGSGGKILMDAGTDNTSSLESGVILPDGKIVAVGWGPTGGIDDFSVVRADSSGQPDSTFGTDGKVSTYYSNIANIFEATKVQSDGKIVAAGYTFENSVMISIVARFDTNGDLDTSFGTGGLTVTDLSGNSVGNRLLAVDIQSDGKIIVAGSSTTTFPFNECALARYNTDGTLDSSFGTSGIVKTGSYNQARSVTIQSDGKIVATGWGSGATGSELALSRYNTDGSLDTAFGTSGVVTTALGVYGGDLINTSMVLTSGKIIVAGQGSDSSGGSSFLCACYTSTGGLDNSFGTGGVVVSEIESGNSQIYGLGVQSDGKIVVAGQGGGSQAVIARYTTAGVLDTTFGTDNGINIIETTSMSAFLDVAIDDNDYIVGFGQTFDGGAIMQFTPEGLLADGWGSGTGIVQTSFAETTTTVFTSLVETSDKKILAAGYIEHSNYDEYLIARYDSSGAIDTTFGDNGFVISGTGRFNAMVVQTDGKIVTSGVDSSSYNNQCIVSRFNANGTIDTGFGTSGSTITNYTVSGGDDLLYTLTLQSDGKIIAGGGAGYFSAIVNRYNTDGSLDTTFDSDGTTELSLYSLFNSRLSEPVSVKGLAVQQDGKILATANGVTYPRHPGFAVFRLNTNGSLDGSRTMIASEFVYSVTQVTNGDIYTGGTVIYGTDDEIGYNKFNSSLALENNFGTGGRAHQDISNNDVGTAGMLIDTHGRPVIGGTSNNGAAFALVRYSGDAFDTTFGGSNTGYVTTTLPGSTARAHALLRQSDGKYLLAGSTNNPGKGVILRYSKSING